MKDIKPKRATKLSENRQFVFIEAPIELVGPEVVLWGEASWWPKDSAMQFVKTSPGDVGVGTTFEMKLVKPIKHAWKAEVTRFIPGQLIERTFKTGPFKGYELVYAEERSNGTRVEYELHYTIPGPFDLLMWNLFCKKMHEASITKILEALKAFCMKKMAPAE